MRSLHSHTNAIRLFLSLHSVEMCPVMPKECAQRREAAQGVMDSFGLKINKSCRRTHAVLAHQSITEQRSPVLLQGSLQASSAPPGLGVCLGLFASSPNKLPQLMNFLTFTFPVSFQSQCQAVAGGTSCASASSSVCHTLWVTFCPSSCTVTAL